MTETTIENIEIPVDVQNSMSQKLEELKYINKHLASNREEIDWLEAETQKTLNRVKNILKGFENDKGNR